MILMLFLRTCIINMQWSNIINKRLAKDPKIKEYTKNTEAMHEEIRYKNWECDIIISVRTEFLVFGICITFDTTQYWTNFRTELFFCMLWMPLHNSHFRFTNKKYSLHDYYHLLIMNKVPNVLRKISHNLQYCICTF